MFLKTSLVFFCELCAIFQNQATKSGQLIEREKYFSSKSMLKMSLGGLLSALVKDFTKHKSKWLMLKASRPETQLKRDSSTGIFLSI